MFISVQLAFKIWPKLHTLYAAVFDDKMLHPARPSVRLSRSYDLFEIGSRINFSSNLLEPALCL